MCVCVCVWGGGVYIILYYNIDDQLSVNQQAIEYRIWKCRQVGTIKLNVQ